MNHSPKIPLLLLPVLLLAQIGATTPPMPVRSPLAASAQVAAAAIKTASVTFAWDPPPGPYCGQIIGYGLYWGPTNAPNFTATNYVGLSTNATISGLSPGQTIHAIAFARWVQPSSTNVVDICCSNEAFYTAPGRKVKVAAVLEQSTNLVIWSTLTNYPDMAIEDPTGSMNFRSKLTITSP